jgi:hypothetical protein
MLSNPLLFARLTQREGFGHTPATLYKVTEKRFLVEILRDLEKPIKTENQYLIPLSNENFYRMTLVDIVSLAISGILAVGFLIQCIVIFRSSRRQIREQKRQRDIELYTMGNPPSTRVQRVNKIIETKLTRCSACQDRSGRYDVNKRIRTRPPKPVEMPLHRSESFLN